MTRKVKDKRFVLKLYHVRHYTDSHRDKTYVWAVNSKQAIAHIYNTTLGTVSGPFEAYVCDKREIEYEEVSSE